MTDRPPPLSTDHPPRTPACRRSRRGFTLVDAVMAIVIASIALPPMLWGVRNEHLRRADPVMFERARWLAAEKLEDIIADRHSSTRGYGYINSGNYPAESAVAGFTGFSRSVSITETGVTLTGGGTGYKTVVVTVSYLGSGGTARSFALSTVVTSYTP